jgi:hypothetical protein
MSRVGYESPATSCEFSLSGDVRAITIFSLVLITKFPDLGRA